MNLVLLLVVCGALIIQHTKAGYQDCRKDVVFMIDGSRDVTTYEFTAQREHVKYIIRRMDVDKRTNAHVAVACYSNNVVGIIFMDDQLELVRQVDNLFYEGSERDIDVAIMVSYELLESQQARADAEKIAIIFTFGPSLNPAKTRVQAEMARRKKINIAVVGFGLSDTSEVEGIVSNPDLLFLESSANSFESQDERAIRDLICNIVNGGWSEWREWSECSGECGRRGRQTRTRKCNNPRPEGGGFPCDGDHKERRRCKTIC